MKYGYAGVAPPGAGWEHASNRNLSHYPAESPPLPQGISTPKAPQATSTIVKERHLWLFSFLALPKFVLSPA